ncbi:Uncharacterized protein C9orf102, partial [Chaetura pelagica]
QEKKFESMDRFLDGVQEVAYIHSNQNVVGSSKAENRLSRWAVRDVFELKQFSQLPANVAVCSAKVKRNAWEMLFLLQMVCGNSGKLYLTRQTYRTGNCFFFFLVKGVSLFFPLRNYRRQFEEMVSHFNMGSVEKLAERIVKATSEKRQKILKEFYVTKHPEMESLFPVVVPAQASHYSEERESGATYFQKRKSVVNFERPKSKSLSTTSQLLSETTEMQRQQSCKGVAEQLHNDSYMQYMCVDAKHKQSLAVAAQHIERRNSQAFKSSLSGESEIIKLLSVKSSEGQQDSKGAQLPRKRSLSQSQNGEKKAQTSKKSFVDLLGDTSILNDIFRNDGNGPTESVRRLPSVQVEKSKERPKDFWDMLNEQNEESLRKLTDITVIEKLCEKVPHLPVTEEKDMYESSLWKKNENFLWKKY